MFTMSNHDNHTIDIGANVTRLREEQNISMDALVYAMNERGYNWTKTTLYKIEHGDRRLLAAEAYDLLICLGFDPLKDMALLYRRTVPSITEEADYRLHQYYEQLVKAWGEYRTAQNMHAQLTNYEESHSNINKETAQKLRETESLLDTEFDRMVQHKEIRDLTYLPNFPQPSQNGQ